MFSHGCTPHPTPDGAAALAVEVGKDTHPPPSPAQPQGQGSSPCHGEMPERSWGTQQGCIYRSLLAPWVQLTGKGRVERG